MYALTNFFERLELIMLTCFAQYSSYSIRTSSPFVPPLPSILSLVSPLFPLICLLPTDCAIPSPATLACIAFVNRKQFSQPPKTSHLNERAKRLSLASEQDHVGMKERSRCTSQYTEKKSSAHDSPVRHALAQLKLSSLTLRSSRSGERRTGEALLRSRWR